MHSFKDTQGRTWDISIDVNAVKRCRGRLGVDLYGLIDDGADGLVKLLKDVVALVDLLWVLCEDQGRRQGVTDEQFGAAFAGDVLEAAADAFVQEIVDFFPRHARAGMRKVLAKGRQVAERARELGTEQLDRIDVESVARRLIGLSGNSPDSSAPTPAPGPSAS